jgi:hypothetical protein
MASYDTALDEPASRRSGTSAGRAEHLASCVRFSLDEPEAMRRLHRVTGKHAMRRI